MLVGTWLYFARAQMRTLRALAVIAGLALFTARARADAEGEARKAFAQGVAASSEQRWPDARRAFQHSLDLVVKPSTLFNLAVADLKLGLAQEALDALDRFEQLANPKQHAAMLERAATVRAEAERSREAARPAYERVRGLIEPSNLGDAARESYAQGRDAYARGDDQRALEAFTRAQHESGRAELLFDIGIAADRLREDERAVDAFQRFVDLFPALPEAEEAHRHLERLQRVLAQKDHAEATATIAVPREDTPASSAGSAAARAPDLSAPRGLLITGAVFAAGALGAGAWWIERSGAPEDRCLSNESACENFDVVQKQKRAAMGLTLSLSISALALLTGGGVWLHKRKHSAIALRGATLRATHDGWFGAAHFLF